MSETPITQEPATIEGLEADIPSIDAIFITRFDTRQGNVLEWCDAVPDLGLDNVEFASLPSGLHNTTEDVIYFRLEGCMGLAVYVNVESNRAEHRGAQMIALGILVKPSAETGRCGQVWRHTQFLKSQVRSHVEQFADTEILSEYFNVHKTQPPPPGSSSSNKRDSFRTFNRRRVNRSFTLSEPPIIPSQFLGDMPEPQESEEIHASHPSHYYLEHVLAMGPSIFVLWKAALLKKRILIYTPPPVETACLAVYNTCLLATIPFGTVASPRAKSGDRIQPLFCVGIHDMDTMMKATSGYVACTTDKLFLFKPRLFDVLVEIPASQPPQETYHIPKQTGPRISIVRESRGERSLKEVGPHLVDNRRYFTLFQQMSRSRRRQSSIQRRLRAEGSNMGADYVWSGAHPENNGGVLSRESTLEVGQESGFKMSDTLRKMVTGGWWWWYGSDEDEEEYQPFLQENEQNHTVQDIVSDQRLSGAHLQILQRPHADSDTEAIRFFHHLTQTLLSDLGRLISYKETAAIFNQDDHDDDEECAHPVEITKEDMRDLGLDPLNDAEFVQELAQMYFGTQVEVQGGGLLWGCGQEYMGMIKRFLDQDGDQDDAQRNVRPKNTSDDTEAGEPQSLVITIEDSPTVGPLVTTETLVWTPTAPFVVPAVTEHQPPVLTTTSSQSAEPLPILHAPLPTTHAAPNLEAQRERLLGHEDEWIHGETGYHLDQTYDSKYVALRPKRGSWRPPPCPPLPPLESLKYGKDPPPSPQPGGTPQLFGLSEYGGPLYSWLHLSPKSPKYDNDPLDHTQPADPRLAFRAPEKRDSPVEPSGQDITVAPQKQDPLALTQRRNPPVEPKGQDRPPAAPQNQDPPLAPQRQDPPVEPRGWDVPVAPQRHDPLPVAPQRQLPIEVLFPRCRWKDAVSLRNQVQNQDQDKNWDQRPHQPEPEYDEGPVLLQYPVGDDCFATISVRVERGAKAAARCLPVNVRLKTDYKEVMPDHLGRLVSETVADEKQRLYE